MITSIEQYNALSGILSTAGIVEDNRFAVICSRLIEVVSFLECEDGNDYDVLTVKNAPDCYNSSSLEELGCTKDDPVIDVIVLINKDPKEINALMGQKIAEFLVLCE